MSAPDNQHSPLIQTPAGRVDTDRNSAGRNDADCNDTSPWAVRLACATESEISNLKSQIPNPRSSSLAKYHRVSVYRPEAAESCVPAHFSDKSRPIHIVSHRDTIPYNKSKSPNEPNLRRRVARLAVGSLLLALLPLGCSQTTATLRQHPNPAPLAVAYSVQATKQLSPAPRAWLDTLDRDFADIRQVGLEAVVVSDLDPGDRADVARAADRHGLHLIAYDAADFGNPSGSGPLARAAVVNCQQRRADDLTTVRAWLLDYHQALIEGNLAGVLFRPYRAPPGSAGGIVEANEPMSTARAAMIKQIVLRARHWHSLLEGLDEPPIELTDLGGAPVRAAILFGGNRSCILIVNPSLDRFVRRRVEIPTSVTNPPANRAVQAPASDQSPVGAVVEAAGSRFSIPVELAPGDAALYELFAVRRKKDR